jgi:hypothetical protein
MVYLNSFKILSKGLLTNIFSAGLFVLLILFYYPKITEREKIYMVSIKPFETPEFS